MPPNVFKAGISGLPLSGTDYNNNWALVETSFLDAGAVTITGLVISAGTGLSVNVTAGNALIGADITVANAFTVGGLTDATTNYVYLLQNGTGTSNTTGTPPANSALLGVAVTAGGVVTSVIPVVGGWQYIARSPFNHPSLTGGPAPTAVAGTGAGTSPPAPVVVAGSNDGRGRITFGTGTAPAGGDVVDVTFARPYTSGPTVLMTPLDNSLVDFQPTVGNISTTGFSLFTKIAPTASQANTVYRFSFWVIT
jgi:hypothetical protein